MRILNMTTQDIHLPTGVAVPQKTFTPRATLLALLQAGAKGTFDVLARQAGLPERQARRTLENLCRERIAASHGKQPGQRRVGRPRTIYGPPHPVVCSADVLSFARQVWR